MQTVPRSTVRQRDRFSTTCWTLIFSCQSADEAADSALNELCARYWRPVYAVICRHGYDEADAQDLTQQFFIKVVTRKLVETAKADRGPFRTYVLRALRNFLGDASDHEKALKRGGRVRFVELPGWDVDNGSSGTLPPELATWPDERLFDWRWAATVAENALTRLAEQCEAEGARWIFTGLKPYLGVGAQQPSYAELTVELGLPVSLLKRLLYSFRRRFAALLRNEIAQTVADPADVKSELRYLYSVLG